MTPDKTLFRPTVELLADFRASKFLESNKRFSLSDIAEDLSVTNPRAGQLARHLLDEGLLTRVLGMDGVFFIRRKRCHLAHRAWRSVTDEELGITGPKPFGQAGR